MTLRAKTSRLRPSVWQRMPSAVAKASDIVQVFDTPIGGAVKIATDDDVAAELGDRIDRSV